MILATTLLWMFGGTQVRSTSNLRSRSLEIQLLKGLEASTIVSLEILLPSADLLIVGFKGPETTRDKQGIGYCLEAMHLEASPAWFVRAAHVLALP